MIALAITFLLALTAIVALVCVADSVLRGWHSYGALGSELRALRAPTGLSGKSMPQRSLRKASPRPARRPAIRSRVGTLRAAA